METYPETGLESDSVRSVHKQVMTVDLKSWNYIVDQITYLVWEQVWNRVQVKVQVGRHVDDQVWDQVAIQIQYQVQFQIWNQPK